MKQEEVIRNIINSLDIYYKNENITKYKVIRDFNKKLINACYDDSITNIFIHPNNLLFDIDALVVLTLIEMLKEILVNINNISILKENDDIIFDNELQTFISLDPTNKKIKVEREDHGTPCITTKGYEDIQLTISPISLPKKLTRQKSKRIICKNNFIKSIIPNSKENINIIQLLNNESIGLYLGFNKVKIGQIIKDIKVKNSNINILLRDLFSIVFETNNGKTDIGLNDFTHIPQLRITNDRHQLKHFSNSRNDYTESVIILNNNYENITRDNEFLDSLNQGKSTKKFLISTYVNDLNSFIDNLDDKNTILYLYGNEEIKELVKEAKNTTLVKELSTYLNKQENEIYIDEIEALQSLNNRESIVGEDKDKQAEFNNLVKGMTSLVKRSVFPFDNYTDDLMIYTTENEPIDLIDALKKLKELSKEFNQKNSKIADNILQNLFTCFQLYSRRCFKGEKLIEYLKKINRNYKKIAYVTNVSSRLINETKRIINEEIPNSNIEIISFRNFDPYQYYDEIILTDVFNFPRKKNDFFLNSNTPKITYILYNSEKKYLENQKDQRYALDQSFKEKDQIQFSQKEIEKNKISSTNINEELEKDSRYSSGLQKNKRIKSSFGLESGKRVILEKGFVVYFKSNYKVYVLHDKNKEMVEVKVNDLKVGDKILFLNKEYRKDVTDVIYDLLIESGILPADSSEKKELSLKWKNSLKRYYYENDLTYKQIANKSSIKGVKISEAQIRSWINLDYLVNPKKATLIRDLGILIGDDYLVENYLRIFEAGETVKRNRRKVYSIINSILFDNTPDSIISDIKLISELKDKMFVYEILGISDYDQINQIEVNKLNHPIKEKIYK